MSVEEIKNVVPYTLKDVEGWTSQNVRDWFIRTVKVPNVEFYSALIDDVDGKQLIYYVTPSFVRMKIRPDGDDDLVIIKEIINLRLAIGLTEFGIDPSKFKTPSKRIPKHRPPLSPREENPVNRRKQIEKWDPNKVASWIESFPEFAKFSEDFIMNGVDGSNVLRFLNIQFLLEIVGMTHLQAEKFLEKVVEIRSEAGLSAYGLIK
jgi:hypothetical protein